MARQRVHKLTEANMEATLRELWDSREVLEKLADQKFPAKVSYKLMKIISQINKELQPFAVARKSLYEKYGEKKGDAIVILDDNKEAFTKEIGELESMKVEIKFDVTIEELAPAELTPSEIYMLEFMLEKE